MGLDLGRVQGAGWFHTSAASSTIISVSSLQPQLTPFVGDAVLFPNGDVRQIIGVNGSTVTLGNVLWSNKGDSGIGNATLSNTDGDSTENGSTQAAIKGIMQAKNYYNQAVYDSSVSNGDGTANVPRKTGVINLKELLNASWQKFTQNSITIFVFNNAGLGTLIPCKCNRFKTDVTTAWGVPGSLQIQQYTDKTIRIDISYAGDISVEDFKKDIFSNPTYIQYQLDTPYQYTEQVIENQPIRFANQEEEWDWHEEWRKGLNLAITQKNAANSVSLTVSILGYAKTEIGKTYTVSFNGTKSGNNIANGNGGFIVVPSNTPNNVGAGNYYNLLQIAYLSFENLNNIVTGNTFTATDSYAIICCGTARTDLSANFSISNLIITDGIIPYLYSPYYGKILHEKDLSGVQLFPEGVNPAQTIGGDWEDKGTVTTSDNTVFHAYRRLS